MKIFSATKKNKQNCDTFANTTSRFFQQKNRIPQTGTINDLISTQQVNNAYQNLMPNISEFSSLRKLHNFKKNYNKVQCNIQKEQTSLFKCKTAIKKRNNNSFQNESQLFRKSQCNVGKQQRRKKLAATTTGFYKRMQSDTNQELKNYKIYPRYKILELYSLYKSMLQYSERDPLKFLQAFQSALNYRRIIIKPQIIRKNVFDQKHLQFEDFLNMYKKMEDLMFIQSMIDYLQIIFEVCCGQKMKYQTVLQILAKRSDKQVATSITDIIFKKLRLQRQETVQLEQILDLCEKDIDFCSAFSKIYQHQHL